MRFGILIVFIALVVGLVLFLGNSRQTNPVVQGASALDKVKTATLAIDMNTISAAITAYFGNYNEYPENLELLVPRYLPTANSLLDSWGNPFHLEKDDQQNLTLVSAGADQIFATGDDIERRL